MTIADLYQQWEDKPFIGAFGVRLGRSIRRVYGIKEESGYYSIIVGGLKSGVESVAIPPNRLVYPMPSKKEKITWIDS